MSEPAAQSSREAPTDLPAVFGRYLLLRRLSRGGMGEIFLARVGEVEGFEKPIVIKKILPQLSRDAEFFELFIKEAKIAIKLAHGNIVPVYEVGLVDGQYFLAMEYIAGRDVRALLVRATELGRRIPPDVALFLVREVANGLAYAHRRTDESGEPLGLVHCDISPPNVLVSYEGEVKLIDFGIAKSAVQRAQARQDVGFGKFGYMAPEQLIRGQEIDRRADVYSTGVLLHELLTGERLFPFPPDVAYRRVVEEVTAARIRRPSERHPALGEAFDELVMRALCTDPAQRYSGAEELRDAVQQQLYAMNPTISADSVAALMTEVFGDAVENDREILRAASQADLHPFQEALHGATHHTVSYAMGQAAPWSVSFSAERDSLSEPELTIESTVKQPQPGITRPLSPGEAAAAAVSIGDPGVTTDRPLVPRRRRLSPAALIAGGVLAVAALTLAVVAALWPPGDEPPPQPAARPTVRILEPAAAPPRERPAPEARADGRGGAVVHGGGVGGATEQGSQRVTVKVRAGGALGRHTPTAAQRRARSRAAARRKRAHARRLAQEKARKAEQSSSAAEVQKKYMLVRREYRSFARAYGGRFESEWQKILFAHTYGKKDAKKYKQLDRMLDALRQKMATVRAAGGG